MSKVASSANSIIEVKNIRIKENQMRKIRMVNTEEEHAIMR